MYITDPLTMTSKLSKMTLMAKRSKKRDPTKADSMIHVHGIREQLRQPPVRTIKMIFWNHGQFDNFDKYFNFQVCLSVRVSQNFDALV